MKPYRIIAVDPGNLISGFIVVQDGQIYFAANLPNQFVVPKIREMSKDAAVTVLLEDVRPYGVRLSQQLLDTAKFIGALEYRLYERGMPPVMISRGEVRKWVFESHKSVVWDSIQKKIEKKGSVNKDGSARQPTFVWLDDRMVIKAMRQFWDLPLQKGRRTAHGLNKHSWQALALATSFLCRPSIPINPGAVQAEASFN